MSSEAPTIEFEHESGQIEQLTNEELLAKLISAAEKKRFRCFYITVSPLVYPVLMLLDDGDLMKGKILIPADSVGTFRVGEHITFNKYQIREEFEFTVQNDIIIPKSTTRHRDASPPRNSRLSVPMDIQPVESPNLNPPLKGLSRNVVWAYKENSKLMFGELWLQNMYLQQGVYIAIGNLRPFPQNQIANVTNWNIWVLREGMKLIEHQKKPSQEIRETKVPFLLRMKPNKVYQVLVMPLTQTTANGYRYSGNTAQELMKGLSMGHVESQDCLNGGYFIPDSEIELYKGQLNKYKKTRKPH
jgi:hypothetical protein